MRVKSPPSRASTPEQLGIHFVSRKEEELFKWFLACLLYGKPIQQEIAERAYFRLVREELVSPAAVLRAGWDKLVRLLDDAHYVRYDFSTAAKLLEVCQQLKERYGTLTELMAQARTASELRAKLQQFKHIGPVTARIFCRELAPIWYGSADGPETKRRLPPTRKSQRRKQYGIIRDHSTARSQG